jgi:F-type H+-transporting ATPase subunit delta
MASLMEHPKIGGAAKWRVFESTWSAQKRPLRTETGNLVKILLERQKITLLGAIVEAFRQLWEADKGILAVQVTTAIPLHPKEEAALTEKLARSLGKSVRIQSVVDPSIIGGAVLQIGDRMVDGSLRAKLAQLRESMVA